jgi:hypothetical protein
MRQPLALLATVKLSINVDDADFNIQDIIGADGNLYFVKVADGTNTFNAATPVVMTNEGNGVWSISGQTFSAGDKFTFAQQLAVYPGGVSNGIKFWTKADAGAYGDLNGASPSTGVGYETTSDGSFS